MSADDLALAVGRIVVRAAWVDELCADLAVEYQRRAGAPDRARTNGASGAALADELERVGAPTWAAEYRELSERRNGVVHGRWYSAGDTELSSVRTTRHTTHAGAVTIQHWDSLSLSSFATALDDFFDRARDELWSMTGLADWIAPGSRPYGQSD